MCALRHTQKTLQRQKRLAVSLSSITQSITARTASRANIRRIRGCIGARRVAPRITMTIGVLFIAYANPWRRGRGWGCKLCEATALTHRRQLCIAFLVIPFAAAIHSQAVFGGKKSTVMRRFASFPIDVYKGRSIRPLPGFLIVYVVASQPHVTGTGCVGSLAHECVLIT